MGIRCLMRLDDMVNTSWGARKVFFNCVYDEKIAADSAGFQKATPSGNAEFMINNPEATKQLTIGEYYYVDFEPVPKSGT